MEQNSNEKRLSILQWAEDDRPREKLLHKGKSVLTDAELIAILIGSGNANESAVDVAKRIMSLAGNDLNALARMGVKDLCKIKGIGEAKAISIISAMELGRRRKQVEAEVITQLLGSIAIYNYFKADLMDLPTEQFWIVLLNHSLRPIKKVKIGEGGITQVSVDLRIIFKEALENLATNIALIHNHPSGKKTPSQEDKNITKKIVQAGEMLQIRIIDHIIFTNSGYYSFADEGDL
jgi:DNA repair protein RadC